MDSYGAHTVYNSNQMLRSEEDERGFKPEEVIRAFTAFIKEFKINNTYIYR
jgi:hypothetical protein